MSSAASALRVNLSMMNTTSESLREETSLFFVSLPFYEQLGRVAQLATCLATEACLTADPGVASSILARSHTFGDIDHEIISPAILLASADSSCQLQAKVFARCTG